MKIINSVLVFVLLFVGAANGQEFIPIWPAGKMPNTKGKKLPDSIANERVYC